MSKLHFNIICFLVIYLTIILNVRAIYYNSYYKILLPEKVHNTLGNLPIVEHIDDGEVLLSNEKKVRTHIRTVPMLSGDFLFVVDEKLTYDNVY